MKDTMLQKPIYMHWQRHYRNVCGARPGEVAFQVVLEESDLRIVAEHDIATPVLATLRALRADIQGWMMLYPQFRTSLVPLPLPPQAPEIISRMYAAAQQAGVGPFAAVAGTIAQMVAQAHVHESPNLLVENGGDIFMYSQKPRHVALLAQPEHIHEGACAIGLSFAPEDFPLALCTSSATIGHSLSLGQGELAAVRSQDGALADSVATALGNRLKNADSVESSLDFAKNIPGVQGIFVQCDEKLGAWGQMVLDAVTFS